MYIFTENIELQKGKKCNLQYYRSNMQCLERRLNIYICCHEAIEQNGRLALYTNSERNNRISFQYNKQGYLTNIIDSSYSYQISRNENGLITNVLIEHRGGCFSDTTLEFEYYSYDCFSIKNIHETDLSIYTDIKTTFDSCGNWISKICYIGDNPQVYYERIIEYY